MDSNKTISPQTMDDWFIALLACPGCDQRHPVHLSEGKDCLLCACGKYSFPVKDGIPVLLVESATILDEHANPESLSTHPAQSSDVTGREGS